MPTSRSLFPSDPSWLDEMVWPHSRFSEELLIRGQPPRVEENLQLDLRYEDRYERAVGPFHVTAFTDWKRVPFKVVIAL